MENQQTIQQKSNKVKIITILALMFSMAYILTACTKQTATPTQNQNEPTAQISAEDNIKEVLKNYYSLSGQRKFGDAYQYVAKTSNISQKDYVDYQSGRGLFVTGFKDISYNYIEVNGNAADASVTIVWNQMSNPLVNGDTYNQDSKLQLVEENGNWKILWKKIEEDTNINN